MSGGRPTVTDHFDVFLSYSRNDWGAAELLRAQLERADLKVFKDDQSIREGELWLDKLQAAVDACGAFVVLVGRDGVRALDRRRDARSAEPLLRPARRRRAPADLPDPARRHRRRRRCRRSCGCSRRHRGKASIRCPVHCSTRSATATSSPTNRSHSRAARSSASPPIARTRRICSSAGSKETLDALACFDTRPGAAAVRWLEINGNSGSGKSSLMLAGLLPLIDQGWLWPRTGV